MPFILRNGETGEEKLYTDLDRYSPFPWGMTYQHKNFPFEVAKRLIKLAEIYDVNPDELVVGLLMKAIQPPFNKRGE